MFSLGVVRSLVLRDEAEQANSIAKATSLYLHKQPKWRIKSSRNKKLLGNGGFFLVFVPTGEVMRDQLQVAAIARDLGMEFTGDLINGRLVYSWAGGGATASKEAVALPFPELGAARLGQLHDFARLSRGLFRVENLPLENGVAKPAVNGRGALVLRLSRETVRTMDELTRALAGAGWSAFKVKNAEEEAFVYKKVDFKVRLQWDGFNPRPAPGFRLRELRLPRLDLGYAPVEILEYVVLMTDGLFYFTPVTSFRRSFSVKT